MGTEFYLVDHDNKEFLHLGKRTRFKRDEHGNFQMSKKRIKDWLSKHKAELMSEFCQSDNFNDYVCGGRWWK